MARTINVNLDDYSQKEKERGGGARRPPNPKFYRPLPDKPGVRGMNTLFIGLMDISKFKMFNLSAEEADRVGIRRDFSFSGGSYNSYFLNIPVHTVKRFVYPDGSEGFNNIICPKSMNDELVTNLNVGPLWTKPSCPFCNERSTLFEKSKARWAELGVDSKAFENNKDGYFQFIRSDNVLNSLYNKGKVLRPDNKKFVNVFDLDAFNGDRVRPEGEESVEYQGWFLPNSCYNATQSLAVELMKRKNPNIWDIDPSGILHMLLTKDTTNCQAGNMMNTKYSITSSARVSYDSSLYEYLDNPSAMVDPSEFCVVLSYEEMASYLSDSPEEEEAPRQQSQTRKVPTVPQQQTPRRAISAPQRVVEPVQQPSVEEAMEEDAGGIYEVEDAPVEAKAEEVEEPVQATPVPAVPRAPTIPKAPSVPAVAARKAAPTPVLPQASKGPSVRNKTW